MPVHERAPVHGPESCGDGDPIPGVAAPMNTPEGIQRCDLCDLYRSDLDAALALRDALVPGGVVRFYQYNPDKANTEGYADPDQLNMIALRSVEDIRGWHCIAHGTDPWIENAEGEVVTWTSE